MSSRDKGVLLGALLARVQRYCGDARIELKPGSLEISSPGHLHLVVTREVGPMGRAYSCVHETYGRCAHVGLTPADKVLVLLVNED